MGTAKSVGRIIGLLLLVQAAAAPVVNFVLLAPLSSKAAGGFLVNAAANSLQVSGAVLIGLISGAITLGVTIAAWPVLRRHSERMGLCLVALGAVCLALVAVENSAVMSMLSLSQAHAQANAVDAGGFQAVGVAVAAARKWAHYSQLLVVSGLFLVLYAAMYRFALIPRVLAAFGLFAVLVQIAALVMPILGHGMVFSMMLPMGLSHLALTAWLIWRGFAERPVFPASRSVADGA
jgi:hypothetical protein